MIIGISGYAESGKDTIGSILEEHGGFVRVGYADKLRAAAAAINPIVQASHGGGPVLRYNNLVAKYGYDEAKKVCPEVREFLQRLGTECGRNVFGDDFWVEALWRELDNKQTDNYVITDVRFRNEALAIKSRKGEVWRVDRPGVGPKNNHPSETALDGWHFDARISNGGTIDDLRQAVLELLEYVDR